MTSQHVHSALPRGLRPFNMLQRIMIHLHITPFGNAILGVTGRTSGRKHTTPVTVLQWNGDEWLQSPYGQTDWVYNLRAAGSCTLTTGFRTRSVRTEEADRDTAARVLQATVPSYPRTVRPHYHIEDGAPLDAWRQIAANHPVFRIRAT